MESANQAFKVSESMPDIFFITCYLIGRCQSPDDLAKPYHHLTVVDEIIRISHAVLLNIWTVRIDRIGPPVVSLGIKIIFSPGASVTDYSL